jgi:cytosine/adenosine deaminase-related metal-dependent hydrolase
MLKWGKTVSFVNGRVPVNGAVAASVRFNSRILELDGAPKPGDVVVDLNGAYVVPGLINAHDHLELNHYGLLKRRHRYENAAAWIDDLRPHIRTNHDIRANSAHPLSARLFIGGLKNLLAGVTTVSHHNPRYREIGAAFPIRVVKRYGWAHSFALERQPVGARGEPGGSVRERWKRTPCDAPFIVHLAEGVDEAARAELERLETLGCLAANTVLVHGVALSVEDWERIVARGASLVWCPVSNAFLFGRTAAVRPFLDARDGAWAHVCLGSDSRITGARDLLDEMRAAAALVPITARELLRMVTVAAARILRLPGAGRIAVGSPADLVVVPPVRHDAAEALLATERRDVRLVTIGGRPLVGAPEMAAVFAARGSAPRPIVVDGAERLARRSLARAIERCPIREPGVECLS